MLVISLASFLILDRLLYIGNNASWASDWSDWFVSLQCTVGYHCCDRSFVYQWWRVWRISEHNPFLCASHFDLRPLSGTKKGVKTLNLCLHHSCQRLWICCTSYRLEKGQDFMPWNLPSRLPSKAITSCWYQPNPRGGNDERSKCRLSALGAHNSQMCLCFDNTFF